MKVTDYAPRAAPFDSYLLPLGRALIGVEIGVDVGAHAQALLEYCPVAMLALVDIWPNPYCEGYCEGRLSALGFRPRFVMQKCGSLEAAPKYADGTLDFVYIDQEHDGTAVTADLQAWWPKLRPGGALGYRNYTRSETPLARAVNAFVAISLGNVVDSHVEAGEIVLLKL